MNFKLIFKQFVQLIILANNNIFSLRNNAADGKQKMI